jgi:hypothetical protein
MRLIAEALFFWDLKRPSYQAAYYDVSTLVNDPKFPF